MQLLVVGMSSEDVCKSSLSISFCMFRMKPLTFSGTSSISSMILLYLFNPVFF